MPSNNNTVTLPAFPLKDFIVFPGVVTEFFIFEPRYIQMLEHCLDSKGLFVFCTVIVNESELEEESPDLFPYACTCVVKHYEKHPDGRYSIIVQGKDRVRITEMPSEQLYRIMKATPIPYNDDLSTELEENPLARSLIKRFLEKHFKNIQPGKVDQVIDDMGLIHFLPMLCHQCPVTVKAKLNLLKETSLKKIFFELKDYLSND
jgi:Lon protease-like protein